MKRVFQELLLSEKVCSASDKFKNSRNMKRKSIACNGHANGVSIQLQVSTYKKSKLDTVQEIELPQTAHQLCDINRHAENQSG